MSGADGLRAQAGRLKRAIRSNITARSEQFARGLADAAEARAVRGRRAVMGNVVQRMAPALRSTFDDVQWTFISTRHIEEEVRALDKDSTLMSVGTGKGAADWLLALQFPQHNFLGTDITDRFPVDDLPSNLRFELLDLLHLPPGIGKVDVVFSAECLEHIEDDRAATDATLELLRPGGTMITIVPFANEEEQHDEALIAQEWENHEHFKPGYNPDTLGDLIRDRFDEVEFAGCYFRNQGARVRELATLLPRPTARDQFHLYELAACDIRTVTPVSRADGLGLKLVARGYRG
jgi:SAM-dependent methyltransferase